MRIKQHFVALRRIRHQPKRATGAQLHMRNLQLVKQSAYQQAFLTPVKLEGFAVLKDKRHKGFGGLASLLAPGANRVGNRAVATPISLGGNLHKQGSCRASVILVSQLIGLERLQQYRLK